MTEAASLLNKHTPLALECAWCGLVLQLGRLPASHGICPTCYAAELGISVEQLAAELAAERAQEKEASRG